MVSNLLEVYRILNSFPGPIPNFSILHIDIEKIGGAA